MAPLNRYVLVLILLFLVPSAYAKTYSIPLLAVRETAEGFVGSTADLSLEIRSGTGRVFLDTEPLTKFDTQISTRFAKEIGCSEFSRNCDLYDFIYTIKSDSIIVGGPSAGAATAIITIIALEDLPIKDDIALTGTINSGGLIGPVGGVKEKIDAAASIGLKTVLIPSGEGIMEEDINNTKLNESLDVIDYGNSKGIKVIEVSTLNEALYYITGKSFEVIDSELVMDPLYQTTMEKLTDTLCQKSKLLKEQASKIFFTKEQKEIFNSAINLTERSSLALANEKFYSAASYCFGANTKLAYLIMSSQDPSKDEITEKSEYYLSVVQKFDSDLDKKTIDTITDLETFMIVKERLIEAEDSISKIEEVSNISDKVYYLTYAIERIESAQTWSEFFNKGGKKFTIVKEDTKNSCISKISEAEERYQYLVLVTSLPYDETEQEITLAKKDLEDGNYELCLFKASKAKANSDVVLNTIGVKEDRLINATQKRLEVIKNNIIKQQKKGVFPIVGYSYYEYSEDLKESDIYSSMIFAEYSLELSNLDMYFKSESESRLNSIYVNLKYVIPFSLLFFSGILIGLGLRSSRSKKVKIKPKKHKKR